jgi:hypothetical protein
VQVVTRIKFLEFVHPQVAKRALYTRLRWGCGLRIDHSIGLLINSDDWWPRGSALRCGSAGTLGRNTCQALAFRWCGSWRFNHLARRCGRETYETRRRRKIKEEQHNRII